MLASSSPIASTIFGALSGYSGLRQILRTERPWTATGNQLTAADGILSILGILKQIG